MSYDKRKRKGRIITYTDYHVYKHVDNQPKDRAPDSDPTLKSKASQQYAQNATANAPLKPSDIMKIQQQMQQRGNRSYSSDEDEDDSDVEDLTSKRQRPSSPHPTRDSIDLLTSDEESEG